MRRTNVDDEEHEFRDWGGRTSGVSSKSLDDEGEHLQHEEE